MARYIGPKTKIARKFGDPIFGPDKYLQKKNYPPGEHGVSKRRGKKSEYAIQLSEKQKAKYTYGILEKQFSNLFKKASKSKMVTGEALLVFCESRLDNTVFLDWVFLTLEVGLDSWFLINISQLMDLL